MFDINAEMKARGISAMQWALICSKLNKLDPQRYSAFIFQAYDYAKARGLDIMSDHIFADVRFANNIPTLRIMTTIQGYRHVAHSSGEFAGMDAPVYGPTVEITMPNGNKLVGSEWIEVTVYRLITNGERVGITAREYLIENIVYDNSGNPGIMWKKRPNGQLNVRAEAQAFRKAFSKCEAYTTDEYEFADAMEAGIRAERKDEKAKASEAGHSIKTVAALAVEMYEKAQNKDGVLKASTFVEGNPGKISAAEYNVIIAAYNNAMTRIQQPTLVV